MINLNSETYDCDKKFLNKEEILKIINDYSIFKYYVGDFKVNNIMSSPFRQDNRPSFGIFFSKRYNRLLYKDLAKGTTGDCFSLVLNEIYPHFTYPEVLAQIVTDFDVHMGFILPRSGFSKTSTSTPQIYDDTSHYNKEIKSIGIKARKYTLLDYSYWAQFGISRQMLKYYKVVPISHFTYGRSVFTAEEYAYAYIENKDEQITYKIYQPFSKKIKFFTDMNASIHAGYTQLPDKGELMLITKSLKDVMSIRELCSIPSISVLSETIMIKESVIQEYKDRFENVLVFFDNDDAGQRMAEEYVKAFDLQAIFVPKYYKNSKDFSDTVKNGDEEKAKIMLENEIWLSKYGEEDSLPF